MNLLSLIFLGIGLSMDAFAVSISIGIETKQKLKNALLCGLFFGGFQGLMPLIGYFLGSTFSSMIQSIGGIIAFIILGFIGGKMIFDGFFAKEEEKKKNYTLITFFTMAIATSIDALAVGVTFSLLNINIFFACTIILCTTGILSFVAVYLGSKIANIIGNKAQIVGGLILLGIAVKLLLQK